MNEAEEARKRALASEKKLNAQLEKEKKTPPQARERVLAEREAKLRRQEASLD